MKIESPCKEDYKAMKQTDSGKHCNTCNSIVVDFTSYSTQQIQDYFSKSQNINTCGRYKNYQVNTPTKVESTLLNLKLFFENKTFFNPFKLSFLSIISGVLTFTTSCMGKRMPTKNERNNDLNNASYNEVKSNKTDSVHK